IETGRRVWVQVVKGEIRVNGETARTSDAFAVWDEASVTLEASSDAEVLLFDLPPV
ncbi:pirin family protein, partial [Pantoea septica]